MNRRDELAANLAQVRERIGNATLIVVTKTWPASDVQLLAELGVTDVGENRDQEARPKHDELADLPLRWHCIGQLQTNKVRSVVRWADVVHSVDRPQLIEALGKVVVDRKTPLDCLIQVNLDPHPRDERGGAKPADVPSLCDQVTATSGLRLAGVMGVAPLEAEAAPAFERLAQIAQDVQREHPDATWISAGMSGDYEIALKYGATHLRIGSQVLGYRAVPG